MGRFRIADTPPKGLVTDLAASRPWVTQDERTVEDEVVMEVSAVLVEAAAMPARPADPDAPLVAAAREEPREFLALYDRYFERVLGYVRLGIRDAATCEDVASTVFTTALAQLPRFRGEGSFAGWLFQIARNAVRDVQRKPFDAPLPPRSPSRTSTRSQPFASNWRAGVPRSPGR
jgi:hypothetical protein